MKNAKQHTQKYTETPASIAATTQLKTAPLSSPQSTLRERDGGKPDTPHADTDGRLHGRKARLREWDSSTPEDAKHAPSADASAP